MINKNQLKGKNVDYFDRDNKQRIGRVIKIVGNYLTILTPAKVKHRVYKDKIIGRRFRKKGLEEIKWGG